MNSSFFPKIGQVTETQVDLDMGDVKIHLDLDSGGVKIHSKGVPWALFGAPLALLWRLRWPKGVSVLHGRCGVFEGSGGS